MKFDISLGHNQFDTYTLMEQNTNLSQFRIMQEEAQASQTTNGPESTYTP